MVFKSKRLKPKFLTIAGIIPLLVLLLVSGSYAFDGPGLYKDKK
jgi:hypothetical protein